MFEIAIIGAGQLGSRHLQGLAKLTLPCRIHIVDPVQNSLGTARQRFGEMPANAAIGSTHYHQRIDALPATLDYVVIATTANVRLAVLEDLLKHSKVRYLLLEKVLFQKTADYARAAALLKLHQVTAWVNCPRRVFPLYQELRHFFAGDSLLAMSVFGGGWGLACNSIHFLDLFAMLAGRDLTVLSAAGLNPGYLESKRKDFIELTGTLRGRFGTVDVDITSAADSQARLMLSFRGERRSCIIDEAGGIGFYFDGSTWEQRSVRVPFLSELAGSLAESILQEGDCQLPTYAESEACHLPLLRAFETHLLASGLPAADGCPIT